MVKRTRQPGLADGTEEPETPKMLKMTAAKGDRKGTAPAPVKQPTKKAAKTPKVEQNRIKIGVDYGTTNSAFAMSLKSDAHDVEVIKNWPGGVRNNEQLEKVPSRIAFAAENEDMDTDRWGYDVPPGAQTYSWTKLLLDADAERSGFDSEVLAGKLKNGLLELPEDMTAQEVATTYLSKLYAHTLDVLEKRYTANILRVTPIDFWFTVPATWQEAARDATRSAAIDAGFGSRQGDELNIITEPEAAAIAVLSQAVENNPDLVKVMMNVLICDLGGGTLDFQVLTVTKIQPQLETEEPIPGQGCKSGSTFIDCNFFAWLESTFGDTFKKLPMSKVGPGSKFLNEWEVVKKTFNGKDLKKKFQIPLPALGQALNIQNKQPSAYDFEDHSVIVTGYEVAEMFEPVLVNAFALIKDQSASLDAQHMSSFRIICLCGGLGSSEYVWARFREFSQEHLRGKCHIFTDGRAWSAVVRGAAIRGLSGSLVLSRKAKRCYRIGVHQEFREGVDNEEDAHYCPVKGKRAEGYIHWPIQVGKKFQDNMRVKTDVYLTIPEDADYEALEFKWKLFSCALEEPPNRQDHKRAKMEGEITLNLSNTYKRQKKTDGSSDRHEAVKIGVVIKMGSERGTLAVEALHGRKVVGTAKIDYARSHIRRVISQSAGLLSI